jgi:hypothetical protein
MLFFVFVVVLTNASAYGQHVFGDGQHILSSPSPSPSPSSNLLSGAAKLHAVKIISPIKGQQVPIDKNLTISGVTAMGNTAAASNCKVFVIVNNVKPYRPATGSGPGGAADYSAWSFVLESKYTTIKQGPANKITAKYACSDNPTSASFYSVNVTGVAFDGTAQQKLHQNVTKTENATMTTKTNYIAKQQGLASVTTTRPTLSNSTGTAVLTSRTSGYDELIYLDHSKLPSASEKSRPIAHDTPFILPFP